MSVIEIANSSSTYKCLKGFLQNFSRTECGMSDLPCSSVALLNCVLSEN